MLGILIVAVNELFRSDADRQYHRDLEKQREENAKHEVERLRMMAQNRWEQRQIDAGRGKVYPRLRKPR